MGFRRRLPKVGPVAMLLCLQVIAGATDLAGARLNDDSIAAKVASIQEWAAAGGGIDSQGYRQFVAEALADVDFSQLSAEELRTLAPILWHMPFDFGVPADERLQELMMDEGPRGADAAAARLMINYVRFPDKHERWLRDALTHPGLHAALRQGRAGEVFLYMGVVQPNVLQSMVDEIVALEGLLTEDLPPETMLVVVGYDRSLRALEEAVDEQVRERVRRRLLNLLDDAAERAEEGDDPDLANQLRIAAIDLDGRWRRGELIGRPAPQLSFDHWIGDRPAAGLNELRGELVVMYLWTTWCRACIASFPKLDGVQEEFADQPVRVLGVTWLQGVHDARHGQGGGQGGVGQGKDPEGEPEREYAAMQSMAEELDLRWPVVFVPHRQLQEFGIGESVPWFIIVDAGGIVRHRLRGWAAPAEEIAGTIRDLLGNRTEPDE